jgi:glycyl-tRNA synthetase beta chain
LGTDLALEHQALTTSVANLLRDRADRLLGRRGFAFEEVAAASAVAGGSLIDLLGRVEALRRRQGDPDLAALARTARRIERVVAGTDSVAVPEALSEPAEQALADAIATARPAVDAAAAAKQWDQALAALIPLVAAVDRFFEEVLVMSEDPMQRTDRLALLHATRRLLRRVGNLSKLSVGGGAANCARSNRGLSKGAEGAAS